MCVLNVQLMNQSNPEYCVSYRIKRSLVIEKLKKFDSFAEKKFDSFADASVTTFSDFVARVL